MEGSSINVTVVVSEEEKGWVRSLSQGKSARKIAETIPMNYNTFAYRLNSLREKLECKNTGELIAYFLRNKLID